MTPLLALEIQFQLNSSNKLPVDWTLCSANMWFGYDFCDDRNYVKFHKRTSFSFAQFYRDFFFCLIRRRLLIHSFFFRSAEATASTNHGIFLFRSFLFAVNSECAMRYECDWKIADVTIVLFDKKKNEFTIIVCCFHLVFDDFFMWFYVNFKQNLIVILTPNEMISCTFTMRKK